jgi:intracellular multiplication protein IcmP
MPAMMSVLCHARRRAGVLAPAQFNFLKLVDRRLWYALHSLGFPNESDADYGPMPNPLIEAVGARAHWHAELIAGGALHTPQLDEAAAAIRAKAGQGSDVEGADQACEA